MKYNLQKSLRNIEKYLRFFETRYTTGDSYSHRGKQEKESIENLLEKIADELEKEKDKLLK